MRKYLMVLVALSFCLTCFGQARIYTRKARLADLPVKTTKVVLAGNPLLHSSLRSDVITQWRVSAYEFCSVEEFESLRSNPDFYFLRPATEEDGTAVLVFSKGGAERSDDLKKEALEIVRIPLGEEYRYIGVLLNIIQTFVIDAMESEQVGYLGLRYYNRNESAMRKLMKSDPDRVTTLETGRYRICFDNETGVLYSFRKI